jgi:hypothetical protein
MKKYDDNLIINNPLNLLEHHKEKEIAQPVQLTLWDWIITKNKQVEQTSNNEVSND